MKSAVLTIFFCPVAIQPYQAGYFNETKQFGI